MRSHGAAFAPLPGWHDDEEDRRPLTQYNNQPYYPPSDPWQQPGPSSMAPAMAPARTANTGRGFSQPLRYHPAAAGGVVPVGTGLAPVAEEELQSEHESEMIPPPPRNPGRRQVHSSEIDDFSRAYSSAGIGTQEADYGDYDGNDYAGNGYDHHPLAVMNPDESPPSRSGTVSPGGSQSPNRGGGGGNRPLWQQNRQQGRNLMWL